jgi:hypothetical protein
LDAVSYAWTVDRAAPVVSLPPTMYMQVSADLGQVSTAAAKDRTETGKHWTAEMLAHGPPASELVQTSVETS